MSDRLTTGKGPWLAASEIEFDQNSGNNVTVETWEGSESECRSKRSQLTAAGSRRTRLMPKGDGNWQLRAEWPYDKEGQNSSFVDVMELEVNAVMRSAYQSPVYRSLFGDFVAVTQDSPRARTTLPIIADCARKYQSGLPREETSGSAAGKYIWRGSAYNTREDAVMAELTARINAIANITANERALAITFYENVAYRGVTSFVEFGHVFRRRITAGTPAAVQANMTGGGKVWTSAEVVAFEGIPSDGWFSIPPDVQWHKDKPRVLSSYGQKTELSYSYTEIVTATRLLYEPYGSAILIF